MHALDHEVTSRIELGTPVADLDTPALLVDLARMEANIARWQHAVSQHGIRFRPHIKTHKVPEIAALQLTAGATGIAVAKVSEAEIFAAHGCTDIVIAYPVVGESKWRRIAALARQAAITVNIDSEHAASGLSRAAAAADVTIGAQIEIDTGFHRCGFAPDDLAGVLSLSSTVGTLPGLRFDGVTTHRGVFFSRRLD